MAKMDGPRAAAEAGDTGGKYSTPVLWDKELNTIVNNESMDILRNSDLVNPLPI